jgi:alpha-N-arabinofuranosidase
MEDALAFGGACISLLNHADRVRSACLAQLVNAIAPIMTETGGPAWRQTILFPFADFSNLGRGRVRRAQLGSPTYSAAYYDPRGSDDHRFALPETPYCKLSAVHDAAGGHLTFFLLNRHLTEAMPFEAVARGFRGLSLERVHQLSHGELKAVNAKEAPDRVRPVQLGGVEVAGERHPAARLLERHPPACGGVRKPSTRRNCQDRL